MMHLALVGVPRTAYTLHEAVGQAQLRGYKVALVDAASALSAVPGTLPVSWRVEVDRLIPDTVADALTPLAPSQVLSFSELHLGLAARVRERLGVAGESSAVEDLVRDKAATRRRLLEHGLSGVRCAVATIDELPVATADFNPPFVVKPLDMTGSIGVRAIRSRDEISSYANLFADPGAEQHRARYLLVEDFLHGTEYSVEGICVGGTFHLLAVTQKETSGFPAFYETGHLLPARAQHADTRFGPYVQQVVTALGIGTAPIHAEVKVTADAIDLVEIHTRFGGDLIPVLMERALGVKVFGQFYDALLNGQAPRPTPGPPVVAGVRFVGEDASGLGLRIPALPPGVEAEAVLSSPNDREPAALDNIRLPNRRHGHILFTAPEHETAEQFVALMTTTEGQSVDS
ncbi:ATP-grasp domain-containing protein [Streptomyces olivaceus]